MKKSFAVAAVIVFCLFLSADSFAARGARMGGGWGPGGQYNRVYNPATVETLTGVVEKVELVSPMKGMSKGVHLVLKTQAGTVPVHLGPAWFINNQEVKVSAGDTVEVKGSRVSFDGKPAIIAAEVTKGDQTMKLRDSDGVPVWAAWRRR